MPRLNLLITSLFRRQTCIKWPCSTRNVCSKGTRRARNQTQVKIVINLISLAQSVQKAYSSKDGAWSPSPVFFVVCSSVVHGLPSCKTIFLDVFYRILTYPVVPSFLWTLMQHGQARRTEEKTTSTGEEITYCLCSCALFVHCPAQRCRFCGLSISCP